MLVKTCTQKIVSLPFNQRTAAQHERKIIPIDNEQFRYLRFRAIGCLEQSGPNGNHDAFPYEEFEDDEPGFGYKSFINKAAHLEHNSSLGLAGRIGDLPDAFLNHFSFPEDLLINGVKVSKWSDLSGKKYATQRQAVLAVPMQKLGDIEVLMRIDTQLVKSATVDAKVRHTLERLIRMIDTGQMLTCSMGTNLAKSCCSSCGNSARFATDYCTCIKSRKGSLQIVPANQIRDLLDKDIMRPEWLRWTVASKHDIGEILNGSSNKGIAVRNTEINYKISFFELSVVAVPAFTDAKQLEKYAAQKDESRIEHLARLRKDLGDDAILDLFDYMQQEGVISSQCQIA
jgi:hypothetical protein